MRDSPQVGQRPSTAFSGLSRDMVPLLAPLALDFARGQAADVIEHLVQLADGSRARGPAPLRVELGQ